MRKDLKIATTCKFAYFLLFFRYEIFIMSDETGTHYFTSLD